MLKLSHIDMFISKTYCRSFSLGGKVLPKWDDGGQYYHSGRRGDSIIIVGQGETILQWDKGGSINIVG